LQEFSRELVTLVYAMEGIYECEQLRLRRRSWMFQATISLIKAPHRWYSDWGAEKQDKRPRPQSSIRRRICEYTFNSTYPLTQVLLAAYLIPEHRITHPGFPKIKPHAPNTVQTPARDNLPFIGRVKQSLWVAGARMQEQDIKFAIKAGMATAMLAAPAFFDTTRPFFIRHWGDWALISVRECRVFSPQSVAEASSSISFLS